jgi:hypothetical protein
MMACLSGKVPTLPPDRGWLERARRRGWTARTGDAVWRPLKQILLGVGGWSVCLPEREPHLEAIVSRGRRFGGESIVVDGEPCQCHANVARLSEELEGSRICIGYALSDDGMWRQHTWLLDGGVILETTVEREQYFGVVLEADEAAEFRRWNQ